MKTSVMSLAFRSLMTRGEATLSEFIQFCAGLRVDGVELTQVDEEATPEGHEALEGVLQETGLKVSSYNFRLPLLSASSSELAQATDEYRELIPRAKSLGATALMLFPVPTGVSAPKEERRQLIEACRRCAQIAGEEGITLTLENVGTPTGRQVIGTADHMLQVVEGVGSPHFRLVFDSGNFLYTGGDPVGALKTLMPHVAHVHVKDAVTDQETVREVTIGEGIVDFPTLFGVLRANGYDGYLSIECAGEGDRSDKESAVERSVAAVRDMLG